MNTQEEFEQWCSQQWQEDNPEEPANVDSIKSFRREFGYRHLHIQTYWEAWQAAKEFYV